MMMPSENQTTDDIDAAQASIDLFYRVAPKAAAICEPYLYSLFSAMAEGHSFIWVSDEQAQTLKEAAPIVGKRDSPLILRGRQLFSGRFYQLEQELAKNILRLSTFSTPLFDVQQAKNLLDQWFHRAGSEGQKAAAALALLKPFIIITGGPGTGKTTTVASLLALLCSQNKVLPRIALTAPTGKAASHMANALRRALNHLNLSEEIQQHLSALEGQTVHRLLKLKPPQMQTQFNENQPLALDILVVDETSMLDLTLLHALLRAVAHNCRVILLGDENQLPSVGAGAVLSALSQPTVLSEETAHQITALLGNHPFQTASISHMPSENPTLFHDNEITPLSEHIAKLSVSHRFGDDSGIGALARAVTAGDSETAWSSFDHFGEQLTVQSGSVSQQVAMFYQFQTAYWQAVDALDIQSAFKAQSDIIVLCAKRQDADDFNAAYRQFLIQNNRLKNNQLWFDGQIIMIERNDYALNLFNGDIGIVLANQAIFPSANGFHRVPLSRLPAFSDATAITVHKSQGSEYQHVWLIPPILPSNHFTRALLYTAITRAKSHFTFWGNEKTFKAAVKNNEKRRTGLGDILHSKQT